jgi:hypothetical protein
MDKTVARLLPEKELVVKRRREDGSVSVSGGRDLKASQAYPFKFGLDVACKYHDFISANPSFRPQHFPLFEFDAADTVAMLSTLDWPPGQ